MIITEKEIFSKIWSEGNI